MRFYTLLHRVSVIVWPTMRGGLAIGVVVILACCLLLLNPQPALANSASLGQREGTELKATQALTTTTVIYVDQAATGGVHDGTSWSTAFTTLQDGLAAAATGDEIWVAAGLYYPDEGSGTTANSRNATFQLKLGVAIYGGFGGDESQRDERDWEANATILSGDLSQNDPNQVGGIITNPRTISNPNAYHVVTASAVDGSAQLDGFIITGGHADGSYTSPCGLACGGGVFIDNSSPTLTNLRIIGNGSAYYGAGLTNLNGSPLVANSTVQANYADISGGGIYNRLGSPTYFNVLVSGNRSDSRGGGIFNDRVPTTAQLINLTISGNRANLSGGAIYNSQSSITIGNSVIWNNYANSQAEVSNSISTPTISYSIIRNAFSTGSWDSVIGIDGGNNLGSDPLFTAPVSFNSAPTSNGDYTLQSLSPAADGGNLALNQTTTDVAGNARLQGATVDIGAYESAHTAQLTMIVQATPTAIEYGEAVTYTIALTNSGNAFTYFAQITDTLPTSVTFDSWAHQPTGATYTPGKREVTWGGSIAANETITLSFIVTHTGGPSETITNTAEYRNVTKDGSATGVFTVVPLPVASVADVSVGEAGGWARFIVSLNKSSRKDVTLTYKTANGTATTPADYSARDTNVTISAGQLSAFMLIPINSDFIDENNESFGLTLSSPVETTIADGTATATIVDDDTAGARLSTTTLGVNEPNSSATVTITLDSQPVAPVNVAISNSDATECSVPASVQLNSNNWRGVGVKVTAVDDFVVDGTKPCQIGLSATSSDPLYQGIALSNVNVTVQSDDVAGVGLAPATLTISEPAQSKHFTLTLTSQPTASVTIALSSADPGECTVPASVTLDDTTWATGVSVQVSAVNDDIDDDNQLCSVQTQVSSADPHYNGRAMNNLPVTVQDDDSAGVLVTPTSLTTSEPTESKTFAISLNSEPVAPVTVNFTPSDSSECTTPASIVLDRSNWAAQVAVLVTTIDDRIDDGNQLCLVQTSVTSSDAKYSGIEAADVAVTVQDDSDQAGVKLTPGTLTVSEPNTTAQFTVTLDSQPIFPVTINFTSTDTGECSVPANIVLNATNWQQGRQVTVTGVDDDFIDRSQSCTITTNATSSDTIYNGIAVIDPAVTVLDDDYAEVLVSATTPVVTEPSSSTVMVLKLTSRPTAPVTVTLQSADPDECSAPARVILNSSNWKNGVGATITAVDDDIDDDNRLCRIGSTVASADLDYHALAVNPFSITVQDNDTAGTVVSPQTLNVSEPDSSATFTVALTSEPTATVTVNLFSSDLTECSAPATVAITPAQWRKGVSIQVTAVDDAIKDNARPCIMQTTTSSANAKYNNIAIADVNLTVADDDQAGVVVEPTTLSTQEPDGTTGFTITLTSEPTATVVVSLASTDVTECSVPASVELDANNWNTGAPVLVSAMNDAIDDGTQNCSVETLVNSEDGNYTGIAAADVALTVADDTDSAGIIVSSTALTVSEPSESAVFTIALTSEPVNVVTINLTSSDSSECRGPANVRLNPLNWATGVAVTVNAVNDDVDDDTQPCIMQTRAVSNDAGYNGRAVDDIAVTVLNEDRAGIALNRTALTMTEPSEVALLTVTLNSEPTAPVTVELRSNDSSECSVPTSVVLDALNWRAGIGFVVTTVNDDVMDGSQRCTVQTSVSSADPNYHDRALDDATITVLDEDVAGMTATPLTLTLAELAGTDQFTLALTSEPTASVTIDLASSDPSECTVTPAITLTAQNWHLGLPVTVNAVDDNRADGDQPCLLTGVATSLDPVYADYAVPAVAGQVTDDDRIAVLFITSTLTIEEPSTTAQLTARLGSEPTTPVTLTFQVGDPSECLAPEAVVLDSNNWRSGLSISITARDDQLDDGPQSCLVSTQTESSDSDYHRLPVAPVALTVTDDDLPALTFTAWPDRTKAEVGEVITYTYQITNSGDVTLTTQLADGRLGAQTFTPTILAPGTVATHLGHYTVLETDLPGPLQSSATVTAQSPMGAIVSATKALTVALSALPQLEVDVVRLGPPHVMQGTLVTYQVTLTNVGHIPATILSLQGEPDLKGTAAAAVSASSCSAPLTIPAGSAHSCILLWKAVKAENDAVEYVVTLDAEGLLNFKATMSGSAIVIVSGPTGSDPTKVYLPMVRSKR